MRPRLTPLLVILAAAAACGGATKVAQPVGPSEAVTTALSDAVRLIRARRLDDAERRLAESRPVAAQDDHELEKLDYYLATVLAYRGDLGRALRLIRAHANAANSRGDVDSEVWMQSCAAWLRWAVDDVGGAIAENERIAKIVTDDVDRMDRKAMLTRQLWDRAFFLLEKAQLGPESERAAGQRAAGDARDAYDTFVRGPEDQDESRLLAGWFAWRNGDAAAATRALQGLAPEDPRGLFILAVVLEDTRARGNLQNTVNLLAPLFERKAERLRPQASGLGPQAPEPDPKP